MVHTFDHKSFAQAVQGKLNIHTLSSTGGSVMYMCVYACLCVRVYVCVCVCSVLYFFKSCRFPNRFKILSSNQRSNITVEHYYKWLIRYNSLKSNPIEQVIFHVYISVQKSLCKFLLQTINYSCLTILTGPRLCQASLTLQWTIVFRFYELKCGNCLPRNNPLCFLSNSYNTYFCLPRIIITF